MLNAQVFSVPAGWTIRCPWCRRSKTVRSVKAADDLIESHTCTAQAVDKQVRHEAKAILATLQPETFDVARQRQRVLAEAANRKSAAA